MAILGGQSLSMFPPFKLFPADQTEELFLVLGGFDCLIAHDRSMLSHEIISDISKILYGKFFFDMVSAVSSLNWRSTPSDTTWALKRAQYVFSRCANFFSSNRPE